MEYNFSKIEKKWQKKWVDQQVYKVVIDPNKPKFYVLDMFPYPSGAGLHVGHPLGYIASDIYSRYKRLSGFNVLHPMGYDAFGLPAEQYAIQTGQHPAVTTKINIARYREQLDKLGFSFDWSREIRTCEPAYYKWTQWAFILMFESYYCKKVNKALPIKDLIKHFEIHGSANLDLACSVSNSFTAKQWNSMSEQDKEQALQNYRLAYQAYTLVNWCPALGTVLANDEVKDGVSERGGFPVEQRRMKQWSLRISAYAQRLLDGLDQLDWSESLKETQRNWIGRSEGAEVLFKTQNGLAFEIFTTRPDTLFGVSFMVIAPESELLDLLCTPMQRAAVDQYLSETKKRTERERLADRKVSGVFSGAYAIHPFTEQALPIWISDYVLAGYGTGAIMAVPAHDARDYAFAKHFNLPIIPLVEGCDVSSESFDAKEGVLINSDFLNGLTVKQAIAKALNEIEARGLGTRKINFRLRDAIFSRQRYWGEPVPVYYKDGLPKVVPFHNLPVCLPEVDKFLPTDSGEPPLGRAKNWNYEGYAYELSTMPGFAGSSAYYLRYMDPNNNDTLVDPEINAYWNNVDLYIGGTEHATGHLIYSRFWNKVLHDLGHITADEPFKKLVNQGMIQGRSNFVYRIKDSNTFVSLGLKDNYDTTELHVDVNIVNNDILDVQQFILWRPEFATADFILENGVYYCGWSVEKMSKSLYNVVNPDDIVVTYGADTLRMYEMFLGPLEQSKPWDTKGIDGVHRFLRKFWRLFHNAEHDFYIVDENPSPEELKILHKTIKKVTTDIENFSFNTAVSAFMICVNELTDLKCNKKEILNKLTVLLSPFAPHIAEELWMLMGYQQSIVKAEFPTCDESLLVESSFTYPVSFNGKVRFKLDLALNLGSKEIEQIALSDPQSLKQLEGKTPKKVIVVVGKIINIVF